MDIEACIFDLDGTLVDSMSAWNEACNDFLARRGLIAYDGLLTEFAQTGLEASAIRFINHYHLTESIEDIVAEFVAFAEEKYASEIYLKPGAYELLDALKNKGIKLAITTASRRRPLESSLRNNNAIDFFDALVSVDEVTPLGKTTPEGYLITADMIGIDPSECVVFEDVLGPATQAHKGGFHVIGVYDESPAQDHVALAEEADVFIDCFAEAADALKQLDPSFSLEQ